MIDFKKIDYSKLAPFRFKKLANDYLLTNEVGDYVFLTPEEFNNYLQQELDENSKKYKELLKKNFIRDKLNFNRYIEKYRQKHHYLFQGPSLHIIVGTLRCNHCCFYCQATPRKLNQKGFDLDFTTAKKIVDFIFSTPNPELIIEFQGGEPLANWPVLEYIVKYSLARNKTEKRKLILSLVSNFSLLDNQKINFLIDYGVSFCTSLDGPEKVHNYNRRFLNANSYQAVIKGIKRLQKAYRKRPSKHRNDINALTTITKYSLDYPQEIVDTYLSLGLKSIFLRPLSPFGLAKKTWLKIGYSGQEFVDFYKKSLNYILKLNLRGKKISERTAVIFLMKIFGKKDPNFLDLRSPCGAAIGQLAYHYNGDIYSCDEGRMLGEMGDQAFKLGNLNETKYFNLVEKPIVKTLVLGSCLETLFCDFCVWKPYCGICPVYNYTTDGNLFPQLVNNERCKINSQILEYLFEKLRDPKFYSIFKNWQKEENASTK